MRHLRGTSLVCVLSKLIGVENNRTHKQYTQVFTILIKGPVISNIVTALCCSSSGGCSKVRRSESGRKERNIDRQITFGKDSSFLPQ